VRSTRTTTQQSQLNESESRSKRTDFVIRVPSQRRSAELYQGLAQADNGHRAMPQAQNDFQKSPQ
jgi:hypothetical protein